MRPYREVLLSLRLDPGPFVQLMSQAAAQGWSANEFLWSLEGNKNFNRMFPGIGTFLDQGMSVAQAVRTWRATSEAYEQALRDAGLWGGNKGKLTPENIGLAISNGIDPTELVFRMGVVEQAKRSESTRLAFNQILKSRGEAQLDKKGWTEFLLGKADKKFYDLYESVQLIQELGPEGLKVKEARKLGRQVGARGQYVDVSDALVAIQQLKATVGSDLLEQAGISEFDLAQATLAETLQSPRLKKKAARTLMAIEQLQRNVQAGDQASDNTAVSLTDSGRPISSAAPSGDYAG